MPTNNRLPGTLFSSNLVHDLPTLANCDFWTFFGGSIAQCLNQGGSAGGWVIAGTGPVAWFPNYFTGQSGQCIQSANSFAPNSFGTNGVTHLIVARHVVPSGTGGASVSPLFTAPGSISFQPFSGNNTTGVGGFVSGTPNPVLLGPASTPPAANVTIATQNFKMYALQGATAGAVNHLWDLTDAYQADGTTAAAIAGPTPVPILLGSSSATPSANDRRTDVAFYARYSSLLTKPQIDQIYVAVKDMIALRPGVPIII